MAPVAESFNVLYCSISGMRCFSHWLAKFISRLELASAIAYNQPTNDSHDYKKTFQHQGVNAMTKFQN